MPKQGGLTLKQQIFVREYLKNPNASQAALVAGYSKKTAPWIGQALLQKGYIIEALGNISAKVEDKLAISVERVLAEYAKLGFVNMADFIEVQRDGTAYCDLSRLTRDQAAAIQEINTEEYVEGKGEDSRPVRKVKIKLHDKKGSLDSIARHLQMFVDRQEVNVNIISQDERRERLSAIMEAARARALPAPDLE